MLPETRYAKCGDVHVTYRVFGEGPIDLVYTPGFVSHIENYWDDPSWAGWLSGLARHCRVAIFDKRVAGLARPGEAVVSRTVKDLVAGSGLGFEDFGIHQLKGVPDDWQLFQAAGRGP